MSRTTFVARTALSLTVAAVVGATAASGQASNGRFSVVTRLGMISPQEDVSIKPGGFIGLDAEYTFSRFFGVGTSLGVARANSNGEHFLTTIRFGNATASGGDTTFYQQVSQPVNLIDIGLYGVVRAPMGRFAPYLLGGVGNYTLIGDAQISGQARRKNATSFSGGGGVWVAFSERAGIQLDARLLRLQKYDRAFIDPTGGRNPNVTFFEDFELPPEAKNTATSAVFTLGFRYIPGSLGGELNDPSESHLGARRARRHGPRGRRV